MESGCCPNNKRIAIIIAIVLSIANACIPSLTLDEVKDLVITQLQPQIDLLETELGISDVTVDFEIYEYEYNRHS